MMNFGFVSIGTVCLGYLKDPPARNYMWKVGYRAPKNYNYNGLWCESIYCYSTLD